MYCGGVLSNFDYTSTSTSSEASFQVSVEIADGVAGA